MRFIIPTVDELRKVLISKKEEAREEEERAKTKIEQKYQRGRLRGLDDALFYLEEHILTMQEAAAKRKIGDKSPSS